MAMPERVRLDPDHTGYECQVVGWATDKAIYEDLKNWPEYVRADTRPPLPDDVGELVNWYRTLLEGTSKQGWSASITAKRRQQVIDTIEAQASRIAELEKLLQRYRSETPLGHQPHMIADQVDGVLAELKGGDV